MAAAQPRPLQRIDVSSDPSNINAISWSTDNRLAVVTNGAVVIVFWFEEHYHDLSEPEKSLLNPFNGDSFPLTITGVHVDMERKKPPRLKHIRNIVPADTKVEDYDVGLQCYNRDEIFPTLSESPCLATLNIDPALSPHILHQAGTADFTSVKWSPAGCDKIGRSVLAVLFRTSKISLFVVDRVSKKWKEIDNLSETHHKQLQSEQYFKPNKRLRGNAPADERSVIGEKRSWDMFKEWQSRKHLLSFTCIEWCPSVITCVNQVKRTSSKLVFLATLVRSGQLFIWQGQLPLMGPDCPMNRILAANTGMFYPSSLAWYYTGNDGASYLACGNTAGLVKVFFIRMTSSTNGLPILKFSKAYSFLDIQDDRSVDCLAWHAQGSKLYLACSKGPHISLLHSQIMKEGALSKPVQQIITGVHLLNVTALAISPSGTLFSTSAEGTVQQFKVGGRERSAVVKCETPDEFGYVGVAVSPNGVFLALVEKRRILFKGRKTSTVPNSHIAILSLASQEENNKQLLSISSTQTDIPQIWDRFLFQEMFSQNLSDSLIFPETLEGFSLTHLQFLRNVLTGNPKWKSSARNSEIDAPWKIEVRDLSKLGGTQQGTNQATASSDVGANSSVEKSSPLLTDKDMIAVIDERIARLTMEKVLVAFLRCVEENPRDILLLSGERLIKVICRYLALNKPSDSVNELVRKTWLACHPSRVSSGSNNENKMDVDLNPDSQNTTVSVSKDFVQHSISADIFQEIKNSNEVSEKCMCGESILLNELRSGRCASGHVWPRCCVTFKLLDGTTCRICQNCNAHALIQDPGFKSRFDRTADLLKDSSSCRYCGGWFGYRF